MSIKNKNQIRIAIAGKSRAGKDYVASVIRDYFHNKGKSVVTKAFADGIKDIYKQHFRGLGTQVKPRDAYISIGETFRQIDKDVWVKQLKNAVHYAYQWDVLIVTDLRRLNEEEYLKEDGFTIIKVDASDRIRVKRAAELGEVLEVDNKGDNEVDKIKEDILLDTTGSPSPEEIISILEKNLEEVIHE